VFWAIVFITGLAVVYWFPVRSWFRQWGSTQLDLERSMRGDAGVVQPTYAATLAVTVNASPEHIWPWLMQLGYQRGGLYSYDWLDRLFGYLDRPSADTILPALQHLEAGDEIPMGRGPSFPVRALEPNRALVLGGESADVTWVWQFGLYPLDGNRTRLVSRSQVRAPRTIGAWCFTRVIEPAAFLMTRRMLIGLKQRAESLAAITGRFTRSQTDRDRARATAGLSAFVASKRGRLPALRHISPVSGVLNPKLPGTARAHAGSGRQR
jgi:hypothetical protein